MRDYRKFIEQLKADTRQDARNYLKTPFTDSEIGEIQDDVLKHYGMDEEIKAAHPSSKEGLKHDFRNRLLDNYGPSNLAYIRERRGNPNRWGEFSRADKIAFLDEAGDGHPGEWDKLNKTKKSDFFKEFGESLSKADSLDDKGFADLLEKIKKFR